MEKREFKAESKRLLELMINSIYTNKEIFLREIISNASDALDKLCYIALGDSSVGLRREDFEICVTRDTENRRLIITDNGIGMSREELEEHLGTIAKSGSLQFKREMTEDENSPPTDIIGQFGVGFYSAFMVSDNVRVISRKYGSDEAWEWVSDGSDGYTITPAEKNEHGTKIIMQIKPDTEDEAYGEFLDEYSLLSLVKKYSDYIRYPIKMERLKSRPKQDGAEGETENYAEIETLNSMIPIWQRSKNEVTTEALGEFYRDKFYDFEEPIKSIQVDAEGLVSYKSLLFIPAKASYDFYTKEYRKGLQLYSSGVLIMDKCEDLVPEHFRFIRGVVDSPDLSLNISREMLQQGRQLKTIAANIEKKIRTELMKLLADDRPLYEKFYAAFGLQLKYGIISEYGAHKDSLQDLLMFRSSAGDKLTTLAEYLLRMKEDQTAIYYAAGQSPARISAMPQTERILEKGFEILYFLDEVDEFAAQTIMTYNEKPLRSVTADDLDPESESDKAEQLKQSEESKDLISFIKDTLAGAVADVKISRKLRSSPVCLSAAGSLSFEMEKYLNQLQPDSAAKADRILELNPKHPLFAKISALFESDKPAAARYAKILFHQALILAGLPIDDTAAYSELIFSIL